jgi:rod shape-determining protein MreD
MIEYLQLGYLWVLQLVWRALPVFVTVALLLISSVPLDLFHDAFPAPDLALISIYFWAMHGPGFLPPWAVFAIGVAQDLLSGTPIGLWILVYLFAYGFTLSQRIFFKGRTGIGVWLGFALVAGLTAVLAWVLGILTFQRYLDPTGLVLQGLVSIAVYPWIARLLWLVRRSLTNAPESL